MILGLNTNHDFNGKVYHVQTEDSGLDNPVIITHCFIGGTIIASRKTAYGDAVGRGDLEEHIKRLAREQHKGMIRSLLAGEFAKAATMAARGGTATPDVPLAGRRLPSLKPAPGARLSGGLAPVSKPPPLPPRKPTGSLAPVAPRADAKPAPAEPAPAARKDASLKDTAELLDADLAELLESDEGALEYPSRLLRPEPLDPVLLAYLLEDDRAR